MAHFDRPIHNESETGKSQLSTKNIKIQKQDLSEDVDKGIKDIGTLPLEFLFNIEEKYNTIKEKINSLENEAEENLNEIKNDLNNLLDQAKEAVKSGKEFLNSNKDSERSTVTSPITETENEFIVYRVFDRNPDARLINKIRFLSTGEIFNFTWSLRKTFCPSGNPDVADVSVYSYNVENVCDFSSSGRRIGAGRFIDLLYPEFGDDVIFEGSVSGIVYHEGFEIFRGANAYLGINYSQSESLDSDFYVDIEDGEIYFKGYLENLTDGGGVVVPQRISKIEGNFLFN